MTAKHSISGLYVIADTQYLSSSRLVEAVELALLGGARLVQYRDKSADGARRRRQAETLCQLCANFGAPFIINDDIELAAQVKASGVHLGREDPPPAQARQRLGTSTAIGVSCYNEWGRARTAVRQGADYIAFGSFFPSRTKPQAVRAEPELLRRAKHELDVPVVAIGGITPANGAALLAAGADSLAVSEGVFGNPDVRGTVQRFAALFKTDEALRSSVNTDGAANA